MTMGQLPSEAEPAWWVREHRITVTGDGRVVYDPKLWWPMQILKRIGRAWLRLRYSETWYRSKPRAVERGPKVETYKQVAVTEGFYRRSREQQAGAAKPYDRGA